MSFFRIFFIICFAMMCNAIIEKGMTKRVGDRPVIFEEFGFSEGNSKLSFEITSKKNPENIKFLMCNRDQFRAADFYRVNPPRREIKKVCEKESGCFLITNITNPLLESFHINLSEKQYFYFLLVSCGGENSRVKLSYTILNSDGKQLSLGLQEMPTLYTVLLVFYGSILLVWCSFNLRFGRFHIKLQSLLAVVIFLKLVVGVFATAYWRHAASTGERLSFLVYLERFFFAVAETVFFCALLFISKGWKITRVHLPPAEVRAVTVALSFLLSVFFFVQFYDNGYYFLILMIMYFFMLTNIFTSITKNTRILDTQLMLTPSTNQEEIDKIRKKISLFKTIRTLVVLYLAGLLFVNSLDMLIAWYVNWVNYMLNELVMMIILGAVCVQMRPNNGYLFAPILTVEGQSLDPELTLIRDPNVNPIDMSKVVIFQYPHENDSISDTELTPCHVPLAVGYEETEEEEEGGRGGHQTNP